MSAAAKLRMTAISKAFPGVKALDDVSIEVRAHEILALVGVNGAGKSTLMNILGGIYAPDAGAMSLNDEAVAFHSPKDASKHGVAFIHQEPLFFGSQSVAENIFISRLFPSKTFPLFINRAEAVRGARKLLALLGSDIDPTISMERLSVGEKQIVEIARALAAGSEILILDEPTSSLSFKEKENLFDVVKRLRNEGKAIIYITHFLDEIMELCDTFVVLRNGRVHGAGQTADVTKQDIIRMIVGRDLATEPRAAQNAAGPPALVVESLRSGRLLKDVSFTLREGEILGLWGLMGSGRTELLRAIAGLDPIDAGVMRTATGPPPSDSPRRAPIGFVTENRHADGLFLTQPIWKNITATALDKYTRGFFSFLDKRKEIKDSTEFIASLNVTAPGAESRLETLSGGNQQKVVFAKWLNRNPRILLLDEPTRGVDVGAKLEINGLVRRLARAGTAILLVTSEVEEMVRLSDRVLVLRDGRIAAVIEAADIESGTLMRLALAGEDAHA